MHAVAVIVALASLIAFIFGVFYVVGFRHGVRVDAKIQTFFGHMEDGARAALDGAEERP